MTWKEYSDKWPEELKRINRNLNNDKQFAIFMKLLLDGETSFNELQKSLKMDSQYLSYHLKKLMSSGLVVNMYKKGKNRSIYMLSDLGILYAEYMLSMLELYFNTSHLPHPEIEIISLDEKSEESTISLKIDSRIPLVVKSTIPENMMS